MAPSRTRNTDSDGPSTADVSANEDVEMQDQNGRINGFSKFSVSARLPSLTPRPSAAKHFSKGGEVLRDNG